jgi:hypothetical protein
MKWRADAEEGIMLSNGDLANTQGISTYLICSEYRLHANPAEPKKVKKDKTI